AFDSLLSDAYLYSLEPHPCRVRLPGHWNVGSPAQAGVAGDDLKRRFSMYSVVLATMLTTGAQTTSWGLFRGCHCSGGGSCGGCAYSFCFGGGSFCGGCSSCCYRGCHGCSGGSGCCGGVTVVLGGYNGSRCSGCCYRGCHGCAGRG